jgi:hypothetical protein
VASRLAPLLLGALAFSPSPQSFQGQNVSTACRFNSCLSAIVTHCESKKSSKTPMIAAICDPLPPVAARCAKTLLPPTCRANALAAAQASRRRCHPISANPPFFRPFRPFSSLPQVRALPPNRVEKNESPNTSPASFHPWHLPAYAPVHQPLVLSAEAQSTAIAATASFQLFPLFSPLSTLFPPSTDWIKTPNTLRLNHLQQNQTALPLAKLLNY